jgi:hypothetical protein
MSFFFDIVVCEDLLFLNIKNDCEYNVYEPNKKFFQVYKIKFLH